MFTNFLAKSGPFSVVSAPIFASKDAFFSIGDLQDYLSEFSKIELQNVAYIVLYFLRILVFKFNQSSLIVSDCQTDFFEKI